MATNTKLTDAQRVVLAAAAARDTGLVLPLPKSLGTNRGTLGVILHSLLARGLFVERAVLPGEEVWRETEEHGRTTLIVSQDGLRAIGVEAPAVESSGETATQATVSGGPSHAKRGTANDKVQKPDSKLSILIALLRRPTGATIAELTDATGWQAHSVRGAISGNLKKKLGLDVASEVIDGRGRIYSIGTGEVAK